jgi:tol-pal system protein YbgF
MKRSALAAALVAASLFTATAQAALFEDDEARRAILDLRRRIEQLDEQGRRRQADASAQIAGQLAEQVGQLRRSLLELNGQIEALRAEVAQLRGREEQLARDLSEVQRRQKDLQQGVEERIRKVEPQQVTLDNRQFTADPEEKRQFDDAMVLLRQGDFIAAANAFAAFQKRWPSSGFREPALFWMGNAQYGKRDYPAAIASFRALVASAPESPRAPEALLAIANCQIELKDPRAARRTLDELIKVYPKSEAAEAGRERLASLK